MAICIKVLNVLFDIVVREKLKAFRMCSYENCSGRFQLKAFDYQRQFCHIYTGRLKEFTRLLLPYILNKWNQKPIAIKDLCDLPTNSNEMCCIIGTIYKHQAHKPSILKEISEENQLAPQPPRGHYADGDDKLVIEDEQQRVRLTGNIHLDQVATGVVCAVRGILQEEDDYFKVHEILFYESGPQKLLKSIFTKKRKNITLSSKENQFLYFISGLNQINCHLYMDSLNLFQYWLCNKFETESKTSKMRLIVAGNSMRCIDEQRLSAWQNRPTDSTTLIKSVKELDRWFTAWSTYIPIDLMPGSYDATNQMMPQQEFHPCMFPLAGNNKNFQCVTNPYAFRINEVDIIGTSGQNVHDLLRSTNLKDCVAALRCTLQWGHLSPTAPDTLPCYPYLDRDPFIIEECPHIYFAGNCGSYASVLYHGSDGKQTRLICIPDFTKTQSIVLLNLNNLQSEEISFRIDELS